MAGQRKGQIASCNTTTIVPNPDQPRAAGLNINIDPPRTGIQTILYGFLHHRSRSLNHLPGCDLVGKPWLENADHGLPSGITKV